MNWKLELAIMPVSDVDRAKTFYSEQLGFVAEHDHTVDENTRFVQLTPPGSDCSIAFGKGLTWAEPGSYSGLQLVVEDIEQAHADLSSNGVDVSEIETHPWGSFVSFRDPDGNSWSVQQLPQAA